MHDNEKLAIFFLTLLHPLLDSVSGSPKLCKVDALPMDSIPGEDLDCELDILRDSSVEEHSAIAMAVSPFDAALADT